MLRKLFLRLFPSLAARIEAESRTWIIECPSCHYEISVWDAGGIRYKAYGTVRRLGRCRQCRRMGMLRIARKGEPSRS